MCAVFPSFRCDPRKVVATQFVSCNDPVYGAVGAFQETPSLSLIETRGRLHCCSWQIHSISYLLNSTMLDQFNRETDGGLRLCNKSDSSCADK